MIPIKSLEEKILQLLTQDRICLCSKSRKQKKVISPKSPEPLTSLLWAVHAFVATSNWRHLAICSCIQECIPGLRVHRSCWEELSKDSNSRAEAKWFQVCQGLEPKWENCTGAPNFILKNVLVIFSWQPLWVVSLHADGDTQLPHTCQKPHAAQSRAYGKVHLALLTVSSSRD